MRRFTVYLYNGLFLWISVFLLSGCGASIKSASPDSEMTLFASSAVEEFTFAVTGPAESAQYSWRVTGIDASGIQLFTHVQQSDEQTFDYVVDFGALEVLYIEITCVLMTQDSTSNKWIERDSVTWEITSHTGQEAPHWVGDVFVRNMNDVVALEGMTSISGSVVVDDISFEIFDFLSNITEVGGGLVIEDVSGLKRLSELGINGIPASLQYLSIARNHDLTSLIELRNLQSVEGTLLILDNTLLESLVGLDNVSFIGSNLSIGANSGLLDLSGLENVLTVGALIIIGNPALTSVSQLSALNHVSEFFTVIYNDSLCTSDVEALAGQVGLSSTDWDVWIEDNSSCSLFE